MPGMLNQTGVVLLPELGVTRRGQGLANNMLSSVFNMLNLR